MTTKRILAAALCVGLMVTAGTGTAGVAWGAPATARAADDSGPVDRVLIVSLPTLSWEELDDADRTRRARGVCLRPVREKVARLGELQERARKEGKEEEAGKEPARDLLAPGDRRRAHDGALKHARPDLGAQTGRPIRGK